MSVCLLLTESCSGEGDIIPGASGIESSAQADSVAALLTEWSEETYSRVTVLGSYWNSSGEVSVIERLIGTFRPVLNESVRHGDWQTAVVAGTYLAVNYYKLDRLDSADYYLQTALMAEESAGPMDIYYNAMLHNAAAIITQKNSFDYSETLKHYLLSYDYTKRMGDTANMAVILGNIATVFTLRQDTAGLYYARKGLSLSRNTEYNSLKCRSSLLLASQFGLRRDYDSAYICLDQAFDMMDSTVEYEPHRIYGGTLYGDMLRETGRYAEAERAYEAAEEFLGSNNFGLDIQLYRSMGDLSMSKGQPDKAIEHYMDGLSIARSSGNIEHVQSLLSKISQAYERAGDIRSSFDYYKQYKTAYDSVFNVEQERKFNNLQMRYYRTEYESSIRKMEMDSLRVQRKYEIATLVSVLISVLSVSVYLLYKRKAQMYGNLARQYNQYREHVEEMKRAEYNKRHNSTEAELEVFRKLEKLMKEQCLWKNKQLSLEMAAELTGSNAATLSKCVNKYGGCSFPSYVNGFRINDAVSRLSDPDNSELLKSISDDIGYISLSTFYRAFTKATGMSPSKFREEMLKSGKRHCNSSEM